MNYDSFYILATKARTNNSNKNNNGNNNDDFVAILESFEIQHFIVASSKSYYGVCEERFFFYVCAWVWVWSVECSCFGLAISLFINSSLKCYSIRFPHFTIHHSTHTLRNSLFHMYIFNLIQPNRISFCNLHICENFITILLVVPKMKMGNRNAQCTQNLWKFHLTAVPLQWNWDQYVNGKSIK